jgi:hypothetical protein
VRVRDETREGLRRKERVNKEKEGRAKHKRECGIGEQRERYMT